ncbi:MAG TPA: alpha/beta hydrolase, partial [Turneriella sp.]|nr:alpha/beta hydrolase [Turneriella sp.]
MNNIFKKIKDTLPSTAEVQGAIQGIIGDKLPGKFATTMDFYADGKRQNTDLIPLQKHVVIFIHGNSDTELGWRKKNTPFNFGDNLMRDFAVTPLYIRYNSGLAVSENGEKLTALLEAFVQKHTKVKSLTLVAHSMGGLITHAAIYHARAQEKIWLTKL